MRSTRSPGSVIVPAAFAVNWLIYTLLLTPLVRRARSREALEADSILATFGMLFVVQGTLLVLFGGQYYSDRYLQFAVVILGDTVEANKLVAAAFAIVVSVGLYLGLTHTRAGTAVRAVAVAPRPAPVGIDVPHLGFALPSAALCGRRRRPRLHVVLFSARAASLHHEGADRRHQGGAGNLSSRSVAGLILGIAEIAVARLIDPGLTIAINFVLFLAVLLVRPQRPVRQAGIVNAAACASRRRSSPWRSPPPVPFGVNDYYLGLRYQPSRNTRCSPVWALILRADALSRWRRRLLRHRRL